MLEAGDSGDIGECKTYDGTTVGEDGGVVLDWDGESAFLGGSLNS